MQRSNSIRWAALCLPGLITLILTAGCGHHTSSAVPAPVTTAAVPPAAPPGTSPAAFQPYTLLPPPPPAPPVAVPRHRVLHLTRVHNRVYLADSERHLYEAGRDPRGHIYPIYRDPATRVTYPLYYDPARDNLYRLARQEDGHFYRNYVGQPADHFYDTDRDYERISPNDDDRPIVTDSYNTYNYNTYNNGPNSGSRYSNSPGYRPFYGAYRPPPTRSVSHFNDNWLWAIPVIIGAYLLLQPHHHSPPRPVYSSPNQVIVRQVTNVNIVNQITQAAPVGYQPIASPRPVYIYPPGYTPQPNYGRPDVRPHGPIGPMVAAPVAVAAVRAAALAHPAPNVRPAAYVSRPASPAVAPRPVAPPHPILRPFVRQARQVAPASAPLRQIQTVVHPRPAVRHAEFISPRVMTRRRQVRALERPRSEQPRVIPPAPPKPVTLKPRPIEHIQSVERPRPARRPSPVVQPILIAHPHPVTELRRAETPPAPRVEHPIATPRRPEPPRPAVRPRVVRSVSPVRPHLAAKKPAAPKKKDKTKDSVKPEHP